MNTTKIDEIINFCLAVLDYPHNLRSSWHFVVNALGRFVGSPSPAPLGLGGGLQRSCDRPGIIPPRRESRVYLLVGTQICKIEKLKENLNIGCRVTGTASITHWSHKYNLVNHSTWEATSSWKLARKWLNDVLSTMAIGKQHPAHRWPQIKEFFISHILITS